MPGGALRRLLHALRAVAVGGQKLVQVAGGDQAGDMVDDVGPGTSLGERPGVIEITTDDADVSPAEGLRFGGGADETSDMVAARAERLHQVGTDESGTSRHERVHSLRS